MKKMINWDNESNPIITLTLTPDEVLVIRALAGGLTRSAFDIAMNNHHFAKYTKDKSKMYSVLDDKLYRKLDGICEDLFHL